ncbi:putative transcriptional regulator [Streptacidiphilus sp. MAP12-16]|uniref:hypothetical protein n=1 Tax=Streptacidiphilus sp. MAP12-16 TaxID=3156300 RepID=UPI0035133742
MTITTIQVDSEVRDRLRALAEAEHTTIGRVVARLAAQALTPQEVEARREAARTTLRALGANLEDDPAARARAVDLWSRIEAPGA